MDGSIIPTSLNHDVYSSDHEAKKGRPNIVLCCQSCAPNLLVGDTPSILRIKVVVVVILAILVPSWVRQKDPGGSHHYLCDRHRLHHHHHIHINYFQHPHHPHHHEQPVRHTLPLNGQGPVSVPSVCEAPYCKTGIKYILLVENTTVFSLWDLCC